MNNRDRSNKYHYFPVDISFEFNEVKSCAVVRMKRSLYFNVVNIVWIIASYVHWSLGEVKMIWKYPEALDITSHIIMEKIEKNSTCDLSLIDDNITIDSLQVVFMTKRCIGGYCRNPIRDRGIQGLMLIECTSIFKHIQDLGMDAVALLEDACNACSNITNTSSIVLENNATNVEEEKPGWWSVSSWNFWKNSPSK